MNPIRLRHNLISCLTLAALALSTQSCREDAIDIPDYTVSGVDVLLSVPVKTPQLDVKTRADLDEASLNRVDNIWIRTYSADTGEATSDWIKQELATPSETTETDHWIERIPTKSGRSYIVAVANVYNNNGILKNDVTATPVALNTLLEAAGTWQDFLNIAVVAPYTQQNVRAPQAPLPMAGCYSTLRVGGQHPVVTGIEQWQSEDFQPYFIPIQKEEVRFEGAIHLRRLVSHVNFNVKPGNENIEVAVNSYRVMNAPRFSWLYERGGDQTNFGDQATEETAADYYVDVPQFGVEFVEENNDGSSSFDFWQGENKHTGTSTSYNGRDEKANGLFKSLTGETWTPDNMASYVLVDCTVDYKNQIQVTPDGEIVDTGGTEAYRTGEVTYMVHLGCIMGEGDDKFKDFSCFRNVDYTYNLTVNGLNDIRVDAYADVEQYHGEEGVVVDLTNTTIDLDAHYCAFNIQLTQTELQDPNFGFVLTTYENGQAVTVSEANTHRGSGTSIEILDAQGNVIDPKYYNWIELRPTTGENVLATYIPRYGSAAQTDGNKTFLLTDLYGGYNAFPQSVKDNTTGWYTVFVNEYTYEPMYTGTNGYADEEWNGQGGRPNWMGYVNQNPRRFFIKVTQKSSPDGNSVYSKAKYGVSQQSIMTYYSNETFAPASGNIPPGTAIGVERENETLGMNLRHTFAGGTSTANGRWNTGIWLNDDRTNTTTLSINNANINNRPSWDNYLDLNTPLVVPAVTDVNRLQGGPAIQGGTFAMPKPVIITGIANQAASFSDPQSSDAYNIEAINAAMNRNRDNNGNGRIDPDELRWYVPAMDQYLEMFVGSRSLPEPPMDYQRITGLPLVVAGNAAYNVTGGSVINEFYSRYMFISSNNSSINGQPTNNVMWAMEGTSTSGYDPITGWASLNNGTDGNQIIRPWQIRCIRNLGANMTSVGEEDRVSKAFVHDETNRTIRMTYYGLAAIRANRLSGNGTAVGQMPVHTIASPMNTVYYGFEYAPNNLTIAADNRPSTSSETLFNSTYDRLTTYINSNPCANAGFTGTGWRVPNQVELTILRNVGLFGSSGATLYLSSTVNYFNRFTGAGSMTDINSAYFLGVTPGHGTQFTQKNLNDAGTSVYVRCVRDITN